MQDVSKGASDGYSEYSSTVVKSLPGPSASAWSKARNLIQPRSEQSTSTGTNGGSSSSSFASLVLSVMPSNLAKSMPNMPFGFSGVPEEPQEEKEEPGPLYWTHKPLSKYVGLSDEYRTATYFGPDKSSLCAFVSTRFSPSVDGGHAFDVRITKVREGEADGLAIGFTQTKLANLPILPRTADVLEDSWLVGYNGQFSETGAKGDGNWTESTLSTENLVVGDCVSVHMSDEGLFEAKVNGKLAWSQRVTIRNVRPMYGIVDLLGNTDGVKLLEA